MIIFDETTNKSLENITLLLTKSEARQMVGYLEELLLNTEQIEHYHLNNDNFSKEITIACYDKKQCIDNFADKYKNLILLDD